MSENVCGKENAAKSKRAREREREERERERPLKTWGAYERDGADGVCACGLSSLFAMCCFLCLPVDICGDTLCRNTPRPSLFMLLFLPVDICGDTLCRNIRLEQSIRVGRAGDIIPCPGGATDGAHHLCVDQRE